MCHGQFDLWSATACVNQCCLFWQLELHLMQLFFRSLFRLRGRESRLDSKLRLWQTELQAPQSLAHNDTVQVCACGKVHSPGIFLFPNLKKQTLCIFFLFCELILDCVCLIYKDQEGKKSLKWNMLQYFMQNSKAQHVIFLIHVAFCIICFLKSRGKKIRLG